MMVPVAPCYSRNMQQAQIVPSSTLPRWRCHKVVRAAKIVHIEDTRDGAKLHFDDRSGRGPGNMADYGLKTLPVEVNRLWLDRHQPQVGGYYVLYRDDYSSFSPAEAFEEGYTRI